MILNRYLRTVAGTVGLALAAGCGSGPSSQELEKQNAIQKSAKVEIAKSLAAALEKEDKQAIQTALEEWRSTPFSAADSSQETAEITEIYKTRIQPKLKGELAAQIEAEMRPVVGTK
jgi:hypothetical protein